MPHQRHRHAFSQLEKKAKLWPVIGLVGARQIGKSTLLRDQLQRKIGAKYLLLDRKSLQTEANKSPEYFVQSHSEQLRVPLILDEIQKAPDLFDAIKAEIDERRIPGRFILSGSTEFSRKTGIKESLTGRIGITHLYPLTIAEGLEAEFACPWVQMKPKIRCTPTDLARYFRQGGMPGVCFLRTGAERESYYTSWLETTCNRDLAQIKGMRFSGPLALDILYAIAKSQRPTLAELKIELKIDTRRIERHLEALEALFVLQSLEPHSMGIGKKRYFIFDAGLAHFLGASVGTCRYIWAMNECLAQFEYSGLSRPRLNYYESSKHSYIHFIVSNRKRESAILISDEEAPTQYTLRPLTAFGAKSKHTSLCVLAPINQATTNEDGIRHLPWTGMV